MELVIDGYDNKKEKVEISIFLGFLFSHILFLIYISKVFNQAFKTSFSVTFRFLIDNRSFIAYGSLVKEVVRVMMVRNLFWDYLIYGAMIYNFR